MPILRDIFTWWHGTTIGTKLFTSRHGEKVGEDEFGNVYYRNGDDTRRWVIYTTESEASRISADWFGWIHHTFAEPPTVSPVRNWSWQQDRIYNKTGTDKAYRPPGSLVALGTDKATAKPAYTAWVPD